jgi:hypothetical protein
MTAKGWIMGGNNESIWFEKGRNEVIFEMMIPMPKGMLFAMYFGRDTEVGGVIEDKTITIMIE